MLLQLTTSNATKANAKPWDLSPKELEIIDLYFSVQVSQTIIVGHFDFGHIKDVSLHKLYWLHLPWHNPQFLYFFLYWAFLSSSLHLLPLFHNLCFGCLDVLLVWGGFLLFWGFWWGFFGEGLRGAEELLSILFKEILPTKRAAIKLLCILRVGRAHKTQIHTNTKSSSSSSSSNANNTQIINISLSKIWQRGGWEWNAV